MSDFLMLSLSNGDGPSQRTYDQLSRSVGSLGKVQPVKVPELLIGTLDSLMTCSEDLQKADNQIRQICSAVARTHDEVARAIGKEAKQRVEGGSIGSYIARFNWDVTRYPYRNNRPPRLLEMIRLSAGKIDSELKGQNARYQELKVLTNATARKAEGNLMTKDLLEALAGVEDQGGNKVAAQCGDIRSEYFTRLVVVVPKSRAEAFEAQYESLDSEAVPFGPEADRWKVKGSPVVPGSLMFRVSDNDTRLYTVIVLRKYKESFAAKCKELRATVRPFAWDPVKLEGKIAESSKLEKEYMVAEMKLFRWCEVQYGEAVIAWIHLKILRLYVESVLRYGMPVDFMAALCEPQGKDMDPLIKQLSSAYEHLGADLSGGGALGNASDGAATTGGGTEGLLEFAPFVSVLIESNLS